VFKPLALPGRVGARQRRQSLLAALLDELGMPSKWRTITDSMLATPMIASTPLYAP
jgi:hypothetical protein